MGKRAETRPEVSTKYLNLVAEARAALGKAQPSKPSRPQPSPARASASASVSRGNIMETPPPADAPEAPMSIDSTPLKSPQLKRMKSVEGVIPPLPSQPSKLIDGHHPDSSSTLGYSEYLRMNTRGLKPAI